MEYVRLDFRKMKFLPILFLFFVLLVSAVESNAFDNVLVITVDTLRADYLGCYGSRKAKTPHIDSLAAKGVVFKDALSPVPYTLPSHVSIFTGLLPPIHGVQDNGGFYLDKETVTLAEIFQAHGLRTAAFVAAFPLDSRFGMDHGFQVYDDSYPTVTASPKKFEEAERNAKDVADSALRWLGDQTKNGWFVWIHFYDPHFPYVPPGAFKQTYSADPYAGEVAYVDQQIGRVLAFLKSSNRDKNTLIVLTADHGESLGEHGENTHGVFAYESTLRVPLIIAPMHPKVIDTRVRLIDLAPTILDLQRLSFPAKVQGVSLLPLISETTQTQIVESQKSPRDSYFEALTMYYKSGWAPLRGFYSANYKYISLPIPELYDLKEDPKETKNLCADQQLCQKWSARFLSFSKPFQRVVTPAPIDSETRERLSALGYISESSASKKKEFTAKDDPKNLITVHNRVHLAMGFHEKGENSKALEILQEVIVERPTYTQAYTYASQIYGENGVPDQAVELLKKAVRIGVAGPDIQGKLALYLFETGKIEESIEQLKIVLKQDPNNVDCMIYLGMVHSAAGRHAESESTFRKVLTIDPSNANALHNLGTLYLSQEKYDLAIEQFKAALKVNPHIDHAYSGLGIAYANRKKWSDAILTWEMGLKDNPKNFDAMWNLALAYVDQNNKQKALELLKQFKRDAPPAQYSQHLAKVPSLLQRLNTQ